MRRQGGSAAANCLVFRSRRQISKSAGLVKTILRPIVLLLSKAARAFYGPLSGWGSYGSVGRSWAG